MRRLHWPHFTVIELSAEWLLCSAWLCLGCRTVLIARGAHLFWTTGKEAQGKAEKVTEQAIQSASVCVMHHTVDMILNLHYVGKGAKSICRSQEQAACPQRCMTWNHPCIMSAIAPLQRLLNYRLSTPPDKLS